jgi:phosphohistidine swiveling domain-containing protein
MDYSALILKEKLTKHWERKYSILFLSFIAGSHTAINTRLFADKCFGLAIFTIVDGVTSYYRRTDENQNFYQQIGKRIISDNHFRDKIVSEYSQYGDKILEIFRDINDGHFTLTQFHLEKLSTAYKNITTYQFIIHRIIDYLQNTQALEDIRSIIIATREKYESVFGDIETMLDIWLPDTSLKMLSVYELSAYLQSGRFPHQYTTRHESSVIFQLPSEVSVYGIDSWDYIHLIRSQSIIDTPDTPTKLAGTTIYGSGTITGIPCIIHNFDDLDLIPAGSILIVQSTIPEYNTIYSRAMAIISEEGGYLSHVSILCRENKIPCIVGVGGCTKIFTDTQPITIDFYTGEIQI